MARNPTQAGARAPVVAQLRIDKWLWAARFYRTRSLAAAAVESGQVRVDGERVKPARAVHAGARVLIRKALQRHDGNVSQAAEALGLSRSALYRRLQRYGL